jgi:hypothetical protein
MTQTTGVVQVDAVTLTDALHQSLGAEHIRRAWPDCETLADATVEFLRSHPRTTVTVEELTVEKLADSLAAVGTSSSGMTIAPALFAYRSPVVMEWARDILAHLRRTDNEETE